ncbi:MAG: metallopeptidase family protein [Candidatus Limnocylindrales bacterium]
MPLRSRGQQARRHSSRRSPLASTRETAFERLVERALDGLPANVLGLLETVAIVIEDEPDAATRREEGLAADETLYGLYQGTPIVEYGAEWAPFPNKITLYRLPLEDDFPDPRELALEVRRTVLHELAHHVGYGDEGLEEFDLD